MRILIAVLAVSVVTAAAAAQTAAATTYGTGCPAPSSAVVYELFPANTLDLSNMSLLFIPSGNGSYIILPGTNVWFGGFTNNLGLTDDSIGTATSPYPFPHAGGSTSTLSVSSNGAVWLGTSTNTSYTPTSLDFVTNMARIAPCWTDLNPGVGGGVYADLDTGTGDYVITWSQVPEFGSTGLCTMQVALQASGIFEIRYQGCSIAGHQALTGYSSGGGTVDPGGVDLSTVTTVPIVTGAAAMPLTLAASARPRLGTSFNLTTRNIPGGTPIGASLLSLAQNAAGLDLTPFGAPGCRQYIGSSLSLVFVPAGTSANVPLSVPNNPALSGLHVYSQSVSLSSGYNALGVIFSNGMNLLLGAL